MAVKLTQEDAEKLKSKELANVIRKLHEGKTLTAAERSLLAQAQVGSEATVTSGFALNWDKLAQRLGVTRRAIQDWRNDQRYASDAPRARADGSHDVTAWAEFMVRHGLKRADESQMLSDITDAERPRTVQDWKARREELTCNKLEIGIEREKGTLLVAAELEVAIGQMLAGIATALLHFPGATARFLVGIRDVHILQQRLTTEINAVLQRLNGARYMEECIPEVVGELPIATDDTRQLVIEATREALRRIGSRAVETYVPKTGLLKATESEMQPPGPDPTPVEPIPVSPPGKKSPAVPKTKKAVQAEPAKKAVPSKVRSVPASSSRRFAAKEKKLARATHTEKRRK